MTEAQEKDAILDILRAMAENNNGVVTISQLNSMLESFEQRRIEMLCNIMKEDNYIIYFPGPDGACKIKDRGILFFDNGGYTREENINALKTHNAITKEELEVQQLRSVILTNDATREALNSQNNYNRNSLILAGMSVLFIVVSTILQCTSSTDNELKGIREQLQKSTNTLDSIRNHLAALDTAKVIYLHGTPTQPIDTTTRALKTDRKQ